jgi:uncharacterized protein (TIGR02452 family)
MTIDSTELQMEDAPHHQEQSTKAVDEVLPPDPHPTPLPKELWGDVAAQKHWRVVVWQNTHFLVSRGYFVNSSGKKVDLDISSLPPLVKAVPGGAPVAPVNAERASKTLKVSVQNIDCVDAAVRLFDQGLNPIVMDAASREHFGGSYRGGSRAQEEELCRRSALANVVHPLEKIFYPLKPEDGIYVPPIPFFRKGASEDYQLMDRAVPIAVGIVAAFHKPKLVENNTRLAPDYEAPTREMIRSFFRMARDNGHRSVVPIALGCGAFRNPSIHISKIFFSVLEEFKDAFDEVLFAVLDDHNAYHEHNPLGNFAAFGISCLEFGGTVLDADGKSLSDADLRAHAAAFAPTRH